MRTSLMPGLLHAALYNFKRQQARVRLFESGLVFRDEDGHTRQPARLGAIALGPAAPAQWGVHAREVDFHDIKADVEALFGASAGELVFEPCEHPALHPGRSAAIRRHGQTAGIVGCLHPRLSRRYKLPVAAVLFELELAPLLQSPVPGLQAFSRQPVLRRDLAVVVAEAVTAAAVINCVGQAGGDMLQNLELFDLYRGEGIDSGQKSLALSLTFQAPSRTLDEAEVEVSVANILASLSRQLGATLRG
jgi:phenylalanyl-tRNA synthetase beta chain